MNTQTRIQNISRWGLVVLAFLLCGAQAALAQSHLELADGSRIWIKGSSSVNTFTCEAGTVEGFGLLNTRSSDREAVAEIQVPVRQFDCGKSRMNDDLYEALKAQQHPQILFDLEAAELIPKATEPGRYILRITGRLLIAGTERPVQLTVRGEQRTDDSYRATGNLPLLMSDFGVEPPTALLGLLKAHDQITVLFDLITTPINPSHTH